MAALAIKPSIAIIGAASGAVLLLGLWLLLPAVWVLLIVYASVIIVAYLIGAVTVGRKPGEFFRGLIIGANSAGNWVLAAPVYPKLLGAEVGTAVAIALGAATFASSIGFMSRNAVYQGFLGYINWLLPLSWLIVGLGLAFFLLGLLGAVTLGLLGVKYFRVDRLVIDWKTGTVFTRGGVISNLNPIDTAFNMGNFAFVDVAHADMAIEHESGHSLNLAAFGSLFHLIGALDENVLNGEEAFSERLAESHVANSTRPLLNMWA